MWYREKISITSIFSLSNDKDSLTDERMGGQIAKQTGTKRSRQTDIRHTQTNTQKHSDRYLDTQTGSQADTDRHMDTWTDIQTARTDLWPRYSKH